MSNLRTTDPRRLQKRLVRHPGVPPPGPVRFLTAADGAAAVGALVATAVAGYEGAAFGAQRSIFDYRSEGKILLRLRLGRTELRRLTGLGDAVLRSEELGAEPAEDVIHDRLRVGDLLIARPAAGLKPVGTPEAETS
jgi:hypothetical protein